MSTSLAPWIILFAPLVAATLILFFGRYSKPLSAGLAIAAAALGAYLSWTLFLSHEPIEAAKFTWLSLPNFTVEIGVTIDQLSKVMLIVVTNIATLVFIYSIGYMDHEEGYWRYFGGLALFLFSMLGIVLADNLVMMFIFWELVGVSSYILIGHYYSKDSAADACKQAFLVNRIGDFGFMLGILFVWLATGSIVFSEIFAKIPGAQFAGPATLTIGAILLFCGTIGKSAQLPLHVWLPNSMEGPTPVSSLLHAATMVAAGVYMLARIFPLLLTVDIARDVIAWVGASPASSRPSWPRSRMTSSASSPTRRSRSSATWSSALASLRRRMCRCSTSSRMPSSSACCSSAPARSFSACTTSRISGRWAL